MSQIDTIANVDTLEFMASLEPSSCRLVVADPPYNLKVDRRFGVPAPYKDLEGWVEWSKTWIDLAVRCLADDGNIFVYGIHHFAAFLHVHLWNSGCVYRRQIIWNYENGWSRYKNAPAAHYEPILWFAKSPDSVYHPIREPYKSTDRLKHAIYKDGKRWEPHPDGRLAGDVWRFPTLAGRRFRDEKVDHPTQKPLALSRRIVQHFSDPNDLVLVPFVGSGSECVAAKQLGRHFCGAELNSDFITIAQDRLSTVRFGELAEEAAGANV